jgi:hypothetical protein
LVQVQALGGSLVAAGGAAVAVQGTVQVLKGAGLGGTGDHGPNQAADQAIGEAIGAQSGQGAMVVAGPGDGLEGDMIVIAVIAAAGEGAAIKAAGDKGSGLIERC